MLPDDCFKQQLRCCVLLESLAAARGGACMAASRLREARQAGDGRAARASSKADRLQPGCASVTTAPCAVSFACRQRHIHVVLQATRRHRELGGGERMRCRGACDEPHPFSDEQFPTAGTCTRVGHRVPPQGKAVRNTRSLRRAGQLCPRTGTRRPVVERRMLRAACCSVVTTRTGGGCSAAGNRRGGDDDCVGGRCLPA